MRRELHFTALHCTCKQQHTEKGVGWSREVHRQLAQQLQVVAQHDEVHWDVEHQVGDQQQLR